MELTDLINEFLEHLLVEKNCSPLTIRDYRHYLYKFSFWFSSTLPAKKIEDLTVDDVRKYRVSLADFVDNKGMTLKRATQNYYVIALRSFLRYLIKKDVKTLAPEKIDLAKVESRSLLFLEPEQLERLLNATDISKDDGMRDKAILELLFSTGLRVSELTNLNRDQVNFETREFGVLGKGGKIRVVFLSDRASEWVQRYLIKRTDAFKPLFIRYSGKVIEDDEGEKMRLTPRSVQRLVEKYAKKVKLPVKITPHGLRHTFATDLLRNGADIRSVQEMLGHKNIATTQIYTHVTNVQLRKVHEKFHSGANGDEDKNV